MKSIVWHLIIIAALISFASCGLKGIGIPEDKKTYVGNWFGEGMTISISPEGRVDYKKQVNESSSKSVSGPIQKFEGDNFVVGALGITTTFSVTTKPHEDGGSMKMTVDGVELTKE